MKIGYIADVVGSPGRDMISLHVKKLKAEFGLDLVIANTENASAGFGITAKNAVELFESGIDVMTGGNHTWDRKEIVECFKTMNILRPLNLPKETAGSGTLVLDVNNQKLAIINLMGYFAMPMCNNPFTTIKEEVEKLKGEVKSIFIDFHAEATSEKRALLALLKGEVSAIVGSHTHVGTDDLVVDNGTFYVSDVGLTGCRDNVIGMDEKAPLKRFLTGMSASFEVPKKCRKILQMVILDIEGFTCKEAFKIKIYDDKERIITQAIYE
ncbi:MAG: TIGR00282 family metallophosphoesterase [Campylobacteraceae bacterium]